MGRSEPFQMKAARSTHWSENAQEAAAAIDVVPFVGV